MKTFIRPNCGYKCSIKKLYNLYKPIIPTKSFDEECLNNSILFNFQIHIFQTLKFLVEFLNMYRLNALLEKTFDLEGVSKKFLKFHETKKNFWFDCGLTGRFGASLWISTRFENENHCFFKSYNEVNKLKYNEEDKTNGSNNPTVSIINKKEKISSNKAPLRDTTYILKFDQEMKPFTIHLYSCGGCVVLLNLGNFKIMDCISKGKIFNSQIVKFHVDPSKIPKGAAIMISDLVYFEELLNNIVEISFDKNGEYKEKILSYKEFNEWEENFQVYICSSKEKALEILEENYNESEESDYDYDI